MHAVVLAAARRYRREIVQDAKQQSHFLETIHGIQAVKLFRRQDERRSTGPLVASKMNASVRTQRLDIGFQAASSLSGLVGIAIIWLGAPNAGARWRSRSAH